MKGDQQYLWNAYHRACLVASAHPVFAILLLLYDILGSLSLFSTYCPIIYCCMTQWPKATIASILLMELQFEWDFPPPSLFPLLPSSLSICFFFFLFQMFTDQVSWEKHKFSVGWMGCWKFLAGSCTKLRPKNAGSLTDLTGEKSSLSALV